MSELKKTAEEWEKYFYPELILHSHHGFGQTYNTFIDKSYYTDSITLEVFKAKLVNCSLLKCPKELNIRDEKNRNSEVETNNGGE